jgi:hypothetical protein
MHSRSSLVAIQPGHKTRITTRLAQRRVLSSTRAIRIRPDWWCHLGVVSGSYLASVTDSRLISAIARFHLCSSSHLAFSESFPARLFWMFPTLGRALADYALEHSSMLYQQSSLTSALKTQPSAQHRCVIRSSGKI